jgi:hypothetical protein
MGLSSMFAFKRPRTSVAGGLRIMPKVYEAEKYAGTAISTSALRAINL